MKSQTAETAAAQWKLALWCEQNGLKAEAYAHFAAVVRLDPKREAAWRKLGFKRHGGRWLTDEQIATTEEQKAADKPTIEELVPLPYNPAFATLTLIEKRASDG